MVRRGGGVFFILIGLLILFPTLQHHGMHNALANPSGGVFATIYPAEQSASNVNVYELKPDMV